MSAYHVYNICQKVPQTSQKLKEKVRITPVEQVKKLKPRIFRIGSNPHNQNKALLAAN